MDSQFDLLINPKKSNLYEIKILLFTKHHSQNEEIVKYYEIQKNYASTTIIDNKGKIIYQECFQIKPYSSFDKVVIPLVKNPLNLQKNESYKISIQIFNKNKNENESQVFSNVNTKLVFGEFYLYKTNPFH